MKKLICALWFVLLVSGNAFAVDASGIQVTTLTKSSQSWNGDRLPEYSIGTPEITILRIAIAPGVELPLHKHPVINAGVLLKGELTVICEDGKVLHMKAGDPIVEVVSKWHYGKNEGSETAEILVFYAGVKDTPVTVKK